MYSVTPIRPDMNPRFAHARAVPRDDPPAKTSKPSKIRDFVSPHVGEVKEAPELAWLTRQRPDTIAAIAANLIPAKGEAGNPAVWTAKVIARLFKLAVHCAAYTACAATETDKRAAASACLFILTLAAAVAAQLLAGH